MKITTDAEKSIAKTPLPNLWTGHVSRARRTYHRRKLESTILRPYTSRSYQVGREALFRGASWMSRKLQDNARINVVGQDDNLSLPIKPSSRVIMKPSDRRSVSVDPAEDLFEPVALADSANTRVTADLVTPLAEGITSQTFTHNHNLIVRRWHGYIYKSP